MAVGLPVVAANSTGSQSLVTEGITGRLIRPGAIHAFADALDFYCQDREARLAAGRAGAAVASHYGWDEVNQELVEAYIRTIRQHAKGGLPKGW
jgi:phosphatidylinositol alpha 1,6-mannosyltransferase